MKQYVLDEPAAAPPPQADPMQALSLPRSRWWRSLVLVLLLEPVALAILYMLLNGGATPRRAETVNGVAYMAAFSFPRDAAPAPGAGDARSEPPPRIAREHGRYVIELHATPLDEALALLTQATGARIAGRDIFSGSSLQLTRSAVAASPRDAWQAVFGDVANFAIACAGSACEVRFVSLVRPDAQRPSPAMPVQAQDEEGVAGLQGSAVAAQPPVALAPVAAQSAAIASTESAEPAMPDN